MIDRQIFIILIILLSGCGYWKKSLKIDNSSYHSFLSPTKKNSAWLKQVGNVSELKFDIPEIENWIIGNGIRVSFLPDTELPIVSGTLYVPHGLYLAKQQGQALALEALADLMRSGGAGSLGAEELDYLLQEMAVSVDVSVGTEFSTVSFSCLRESLMQALPIFLDIIQDPKIDPARLETWKKHRTVAIDQRKESADDMASIAFNQLLNQGTYFEKLSTKAEVQNLNRADLLKVHREFFRSNNSRLVLSGDLNSEEAHQIALDYFANWENSQNIQEVFLAPAFQPKSGIYFLSGNFEQSTIYIGQRGPVRLGKDHHAIQVFNDIFGAKSFTSRLSTAIRKKRGWAYYTFGGIEEDVMPGKNVIYLRTKSQQTVPAIEESINVLQKIQDKGITKREREDVLRNIQNSFVFLYDGSSKIVNRQVVLDLLKYPENYQADYLAEIASVSNQQVQNVAKGYWSIEDFIVLVVGPSSTYNQLEAATQDPESSLFKKPLKKLSFDEQTIL